MRDSDRDIDNDPPDEYDTHAPARGILTALVLGALFWALLIGGCCLATGCATVAPAPDADEGEPPWSPYEFHNTNEMIK